MGHFQGLRRDYERLSDIARRNNVNPLGACALAGTTLPTDRFMTTRALGFERPTENGLDTIGSRDGIAEYIFNAALSMARISGFAEEIVTFASSEFSFIDIDDAYCTGSSIMPQKKNPDMAELIRGKTGRVYGDLMTLLTIMKGLPLAYNKDMQEDKIPVFDAGDTLKASLNIFREMFETITFRTETMEQAAKSGFMNATDAADYLVSKGLAFRDCHEIIGKIVLHCSREGKAIEDLSLEELKRFSDKFEDDVYGHIDVRACIAAKKSEGSTSFDSVAKQLADIEKARKK
jgi:argininosuccinate lyase